LIGVSPFVVVVKLTAERAPHPFVDLKVAFIEGIEHVGRAEKVRLAVTEVRLDPCDSSWR